MVFLIYAGDALWVLALSIMAGASRNAWRRTDADTLIPMQFHADGTPGWRARRPVALCALPGMAFAISLLLFVPSRNMGLGVDAALILFGVRATLAALFPLVHLRWLKAAMAQLEAEGALKS